MGTLRDLPGTLQHRLNTFLFSYRRSPNIKTGESPAKRFLNREIRSRLNILKPDPIKDVVDKMRKDNVVFSDRSFLEGKRVAVLNYNSPNKKWTFGTVVNKDGCLQFTSDVNGHLLRRHIDQIRPCGQSFLVADNETINSSRYIATQHSGLTDGSPPVSPTDQDKPRETSVTSSPIPPSPAPTYHPEREATRTDSPVVHAEQRRSKRTQKKVERLNL